MQDKEIDLEENSDENKINLEKWQNDLKNIQISK